MSMCSWPGCDRAAQNRRGLCRKHEEAKRLSKKDIEQLWRELEGENEGDIDEEIAELDFIPKPRTAIPPPAAPVGVPSPDDAVTGKPLEPRSESTRQPRPSPWRGATKAMVHELVRCVQDPEHIYECLAAAAREARRV